MTSRFVGQLLPVTLFGLVIAGPARAAVEPGCTLTREAHYQCDATAFQQRLTRARMVRIDTERMDLFAAEQLRKLVHALGKQEAGSKERPDLVFDLAPVDRSGRIDFGPADVPLGMLSVYDPAKGTGQRGLIWVETFDGQEDRPWPSVVTDLVHRVEHDAQQP